MLKAGGAYVPLDPNYPRDRIAFMIDDAELLLVLTQKDLAKDIPGSAAIFCIDEHWKTIAGENYANPVTAATASNIASRNSRVPAGPVRSSEIGPSSGSTVTVKRRNRQHWRSASIVRAITGRMSP